MIRDDGGKQQREKVASDRPLELWSIDSTFLLLLRKFRVSTNPAALQVSITSLPPPTLQISVISTGRQLPPLPSPLTHSLTHSKTHSLSVIVTVTVRRHSLTHSPTHSLPPSLTDSLPHSQSESSAGFRLSNFGALPRVDRYSMPIPIF